MFYDLKHRDTARTINRGKSGGVLREFNILVVHYTQLCYFADRFTREAQPRTPKRLKWLILFLQTYDIPRSSGYVGKFLPIIYSFIFN
jgi:hypothetical protein